MKQKKKATTTRTFCCVCRQTHPASKMTTIAREHQRHIEERFGVKIEYGEEESLPIVTTMTKIILMILMVQQERKIKWYNNRQASIRIG